MLTFLKEKFHKEPKEKKPKEFRRQKVVPKYSDQFKAEVMFQRFGSYDDVSKCYVSRGYLAKRFNVKFTTINSWCHKHKRDPGCLWDKYRYKGRPRRKFYTWQYEAICSNAALFRQRFMSLHERVEYLWLQHFIWISYTSLWRLYKRHGVKYIKARSMRKNL